VKFRPIRSVLQYPGGENDGPVPYLFNVAGALGKIHSEFEWRLFDFCRLHQIVYGDLAEKYKKMELFESEHEELLRLTGNVDDDGEIFRIRVLDRLIEQRTEMQRVKQFADQMAVVGLWAICEQTLGRVYRHYRAHLDSKRPEQIKSPYRWADFLRRFLDVGVDVRQLDGFSDANECRVVNNSIKHDGVVRGELALFGFFFSYVGRDLMDVSLEMQRYVNGVSNFLGSLIELLNGRMSTVGGSSS
jgi:hypothetical protein